MAAEGPSYSSNFFTGFLLGQGEDYVGSKTYTWNTKVVLANRVESSIFDLKFSKGGGEQFQLWFKLELQRVGPSLYLTIKQIKGADFLGSGEPRGWAAQICYQIKVANKLDKTKSVTFAPEGSALFDRMRMSHTISRLCSAKVEDGFVAKDGRVTITVTLKPYYYSKGYQI